MSTPFPLEEEAQTNAMRGEWNPWKGPAEPHWYSGLGFNDESHYLGPFGRALDAAGAGAAKGEAVLGGLIHQSEGVDYDVDTAGGLIATKDKSTDAENERAGMNPLANVISADAKMRVQAMTPNATTTGSAVQLLHGLVSGFTEMSIGGLAGGTGGAAALVGSSEGLQRYNDLIDAGVDPDTARKSALLTGGAAAAGAVVPAGVGSSLAAKVTSGAVGNTIFGVANRYADHKILESAGYPEMAAQQKVIDGTQVITDLILGAAFGGLAHLHSTPEVEAMRNAPGARDAALTTNLAIKDRESAPGIPADPEAANAHQAALESSIADMMQGKAVDVSDSRVTEAKFVERQESRAPEIETAVRESIKETGLFGEANDRDVQAILEGRKPESVKSEPAAEEEGYTVGEQELTDEQIKEFQGLRSDVQADKKLGAAGDGESGQSGNQNDGESRTRDGEPITVFRGSGRDLVPEHFDLDTLGKATGHPSSGLGVFFSKDRAEAARYGQVSEHHLDIKNPKIIKAEDLPGFGDTHEANAYREKLRAQGYDGMVIDASHLGGPVNYVAFKPEQVFAAERALGRITRFETAKGSKYDVTEHGTTVRDKAERAEVGHEGDKGRKPESERTIYVSKADAQKLAEFQTQGAKRSVVPVKGGRFGVRWDEGQDTGKVERRTVVTPKDEPSVGLTPVEIWNGGKEVHFGNEITRIEREGERPPTRGPEPRETVASRDPTEQALADHPGLTIPDENGNPVSAHDALAQAQAEVATTRRESQIAAKAAITCYMRRGN